jgi:hypothetical protein
MPRTDAFFASPLAEAFGDDECPIEQARADQIPGGVLLMHGKPYGRDALLRWMAQGGTHPLTRAPLRIDDMHPVMTPDTRMEDYTHTVDALSARGWTGQAEVEADIAARRLAFKRDVDGNRLNHPLDAMEQALRRNPWWVFTHNLDRQQARRNLDLLMVRRALGEGAAALPYVTCVLENRRRMWRFPPGSETFPIYMDMDVLAQDIAAISNGLALDALRLLVQHVAHRRQFAGAHDQRPNGRGPRLNIVLYPPNAVEWMQRIAIPSESEIDRAWWRRPHRIEDVVDRLVALQSRCPVHLHFNRATLQAAAIRCMTRQVEQALYEPQRHHVDGAFIVHPADEWLLRGEPGRANHIVAWETADGHAQAILLRHNHGGINPFRFSHAELSAAVERMYLPHGPLEGYRFSDAQFQTEIRADPRLLPSLNPYETPHLRPALQYGLECIEAEALGP